MRRGWYPLRNDDFIITVGFPITFTRWNHTWLYIFIIPFRIGHVSRHTDIFSICIPGCPRSLRLAITLDAADDSAAAMRMERRRAPP